ncbi:MAG TPA: PH domain-containing protein [Microthrixaceae bacterium]|nr:PH domain-containing protein [Microthrixaceae bacterium]
MAGIHTRAPDEPVDRVLSMSCWWGGFFVGPLLGAAVYASSPPGTLRRAHGGAAAVMWTAVLAVWAPLTLWILVFARADPTVLLFALPVVLGVTIGSSTIATVQIRRGRHFSGARIETPSTADAAQSAVPSSANIEAPNVWSGQVARRSVRARGFLIWMLRWNGVVVGFWSTLWMRGTALVLGWAAVAGWLLLTLRPRVTATPDGLWIRGLLRSTWVPRDAIRGLTVDREYVWWYRTIDMAVLPRGKPQLRVPWASWNPWFESGLTVPGSALPQPRQQRVLDPLLEVLGKPHTASRRILGGCGR